MKWPSSYRQANISKGPSAQAREKYPILIALLASNFIALTLAALTLREWRGTYEMSILISENPAAVGIVVQIVSQLLGLIVVKALCILMNLNARIKLATGSLSLEHLGFANALSCNRLDFTLGSHYLGLLVLFVLFNMLPAALWAGAITPVLSNSSRIYPISVPDYSDSSGIKYFSFIDSNYSKVDALGTHTFDPEFELAGQILGNARDTYSTTGGVSSHAKLDKTGYVYQTRSYGMGAAVGLVDTIPEKVLYYTYLETGLQASATCIYNDTSDLHLQWLCCDEDWGWKLVIFNARGMLPNGWSVMYAAASMGKDQAFALGAALVNSSAYLALTAYVEGVESRYSALHKIQCQLRYEPYDFLVNVNVTQKSINVIPQQRTRKNSHQSDWADFATNRVQKMSSMMATTQWRSFLGDLFLNNIANVARVKGKSNSTNLLGVATAVESMLDNMLEAGSAAQMVVLNSSHLAKAEAQIPSFAFGSREYTFLVLAINLLVGLLLLTQTVRTRGWENAPRFDFVDIKTVIINSAMPGNRIFETASQLSTAKENGKMMSDDAHVKHMRIKFVDRETETKLVAQVDEPTLSTNSDGRSSTTLQNLNWEDSNTTIPLLKLDLPAADSLELLPKRRSRSSVSLV